jgi:hypothetical protein
MAATPDAQKIADTVMTFHGDFVFPPKRATGKFPSHAHYR